MNLATGTVLDGKVAVEGETLAEGKTVMLLLRENSETFELTPEEEYEILNSIDALKAIVFRRRCAPPPAVHRTLR